MMFWIYIFLFFVSILCVVIGLRNASSTAITLYSKITRFEDEAKVLVNKTTHNSNPLKGPVYIGKEYYYGKEASNEARTSYSTENLAAALESDDQKLKYSVVIALLGIVGFCVFPALALFTTEAYPFGLVFILCVIGLKPFFTAIFKERKKIRNDSQLSKFN